MGLIQRTFIWAVDGVQVTIVDAFTYLTRSGPLGVKVIWWWWWWLERTEEKLKGEKVIGGYFIVQISLNVGF